MENLVVQGVAAVVALAVYFLPSILADRRKRYDLLTIALFNAVVGWTVFGWLLALYWALQPNPPEKLATELVKTSFGGTEMISFGTFSDVSRIHRNGNTVQTTRPAAPSAMAMFRTG